MVWFCVWKWVWFDFVVSYIQFMYFSLFSLQKVCLFLMGLDVCVFRYWSLLVMQQGTTRRIELCRGTSNLRWGMTRSWASFLGLWLLPMEESCQISTRPFCLRRLAKGRVTLDLLLRSSSDFIVSLFVTTVCNIFMFFCFVLVSTEFSGYVLLMKWIFWLLHNEYISNEPSFLGLFI